MAPAAISLRLKQNGGVRPVTKAKSLVFFMSCDAAAYFVGMPFKGRGQEAAAGFCLGVSQRSQFTHPESPSP